MAIRERPRATPCIRKLQAYYLGWERGAGAMLRKRSVLVLLAVLAVTGCGKKSSLYLQPGRENVARAEPASGQPASSATGNSD